MQLLGRMTGKNGKPFTQKSLPTGRQPTSSSVAAARCAGTASTSASGVGSGSLSMLSKRRLPNAPFAVAPDSAQAAPAVRGDGVQATQAATYQVLLAILGKLHGTPAQERFLRARPEATAIPFLTWLADQEAAAALGPRKQRLADLCERLVLFREQLDADGMDDLHKRTLGRLTAGSGLEDEEDNQNDPRQSSMLAVRKEEQAALVANPKRFAMRLAEAVTGAPVVSTGYSPMVDVLLQVAPPAALTAEGVRQGHEQARELAEELRRRRTRSVGSIIGRAKLTPQQADHLLAGSSAARILDMLLGLPTSADRLASLPDCFTLPELVGEGPALGCPSGGSGTSSSGHSGAVSGNDAAEVDVLWCTPSQLLNELDSRIAAVTGAAGGSSKRPLWEQPAPAAQKMLGGGPQQLVGPALLAELQLMRSAVEQQWLEALGTGGSK